ncbi:PREDICTED: uncharacterized protein LOC109372158 [Hipposideros armiger]|uniref:Uncharacterized protein LOC109372158 n=1 Tax=Hipposideros armiger TaxID=186990 RepID=A0A8B7PW35_HIPAR|nr:PREDICTED: uncharacterized protein LOC109372158 [Hipposideros armiger]
MVAREWVRRRKGTEGRGAGGTREGRGGADHGFPSGRRRGWGGSRGSQSRLGPIAVSEERGARRAEAPGARWGELGKLEAVFTAARPRQSREWIGGCRRRRSPRASGAPLGASTATRALSQPASLAGGRAGRLLPGHWMESGSRLGLGVSVRPGRAGQDSAPGWNCPLAGAAAAAAAAACSRVLPVIVKCFGNQHLERAIFSLEISNQSASFPLHYNPLTYRSYVSLQKEKKMNKQ